MKHSVPHNLPLDAARKVAQHAIDAGTIELLQAVLQGTCVDSQLEAAWCVTNIAAGSSAHTEAEILTSQYLVTFNQ